MFIQTNVRLVEEFCAQVVRGFVPRRGQTNHFLRSSSPSTNPLASALSQSLLSPLKNYLYLRVIIGDSPAGNESIHGILVGPSAEKPFVIGSIDHVVVIANYSPPLVPKYTDEEPLCPYATRGSGIRRHFAKTRLVFGLQDKW